MQGHIKAVDEGAAASGPPKIGPLSSATAVDWGQRQAYIGGPIIYGGPINNVIDNMYNMSY